MKPHWNQIRQIPALLVVAVALAGCGGNPYQEAILAPPGNTGSPGTVPFPIPTSTPDPGPPPGNLLPPLSFTGTVTGNGSWSTTVTTDNLLKVKLKAGPAGTITVSGSNFNGTYSCASYLVTVFGQGGQTQILSVGGGGNNCPGNPSSQIIDFSSRMTPGHGPVTISVTNVLYDFYYSGCLASPGLYGVYTYPFHQADCYNRYFQHTVYTTHTVSFGLDVQVNGTSL